MSKKRRKKGKSGKSWFGRRKDSIVDYAKAHPFLTANRAGLAYGGVGTALTIGLGIAAPYALPLLAIPIALEAGRKGVRHYTAPRREFEDNVKVSTIVTPDVSRDDVYSVITIDEGTYKELGEPKPEIVTMEYDGKLYPVSLNVIKKSLGKQDGSHKIKTSLPIDADARVTLGTAYKARPAKKIKAKTFTGKGKFDKGEENIIPIDYLKRIEPGKRTTLSNLFKGKAYETTAIEGNTVPFIGYDKKGNPVVGSTIKISHAGGRITLKDSDNIKKLRVYLPYFGGVDERRELVDKLLDDYEQLCDDSTKVRALEKMVQGMSTKGILELDEMYVSMLDKGLSESGAELVEKLGEKDEIIAEKDEKIEELEEQLDGFITT